ncbi:sensor histidine kinase [Chelativorans salis]|uniref:histidine kinase n=1 Tax=Chelativorans salis TaxID=2978478 RepID=A0ABT2LNA8_9HYPH|nr:HAMP domain-containing sensor histidine kinase [Chelativorans sp. EGI FJ00035]MCT7376046.1 HAMP domain-containing histidine kinase [Chelativorans sp. EGI FJ00035]
MPALPAIMKTTAARLSALYLILFAICAVVLVIYVTSLSVRMITTQTREAIAEEVSGLGRAYQRGGLPTLVRAMEMRARQPGANLYLITDPNGLILSGNVESIQPGVLDTVGWTERPFTYRRYGEDRSESSRHTAVAQVIRLPNRMILLVGRDLGEPERFRNVVRNALMAALGMMGFGALLIWYFVGRRALKRIDNVSAASRQIMGGDLSRRLPVSGAGDEFDRLSENLNAMLDRIAALNEGLKQVSANIAHDLKTPLTRLRNRAEAALNRREDEAACREALEQTIAESDQLIRTFNAILMISRLEAGYSAETTKSVDLSAIVADVVELYEPAAEEMGVELKAEADVPMRIDGNRELIGQALSNIVDNAIKYSAGGANEKPAVSVSLQKQADAVRMTVRDNGPGIPEADRERATERFVRLEASRTQPGSGIGLSLAKAVMTFHGGSLELSGDGEGLSVAMVFPTGKNG